MSAAQVASTPLRIGDVLTPFNETLGNTRVEPPVLTLTERNGFIAQKDRFNKRLATTDVSKYKVIRQRDFAFNPYLLWAGALAQNDRFETGLISPLYPTFSVNDGYDSKYLKHILLAPPMIQKYDSIAFGSVPRRRRSSVKNFLNLTLPVFPPLDEQRRIASILDEASELRNEATRAISKTARAEASLYRSMFTETESVWPTVPVEELASPGKKSMRTGPFGSQLLKEEFTDDGVPVLGIDNAVHNKFRWGERRYIAESKYEQLKRYTVHPGDVLITIMGTNGRVAIVPDDIPTAINTKHLCCITLNQEKCLPEFLRATFLWHPTARHHLTSKTKGAIMGGLNMGIIKTMPVKLPPLDIQREFVERLRTIQELHQGQASRASRMDALLSSLQSRAFRGEL